MVSWLFFYRKLPDMVAVQLGHGPLMTGKASLSNFCLYFLGALQGVLVCSFGETNVYLEIYS